MLLAAWREQHQIEASMSLSAEGIEELKRQVRDTESQRERLLDAYQNGVIEPDELTARRQSIDQRPRSAKGSPDKLSRGAEPALSLRELESSIQKVCR